MAKITAKSRPNGTGDVRIEGRLDDAALLVLDTVMQLGAQIRHTLVSNGVKQIEPEGEAPNDFALAMVHMTRAVKNRERDTVDTDRGQPTLRLVGQDTDAPDSPDSGAVVPERAGESSQVEAEVPEGGREPPHGEDQ